MSVMKHVSWLRVWVALVAVVLIAGTLAGPSTVSAMSAVNLQRSMLSTVKLWIVQPDGQHIYGTCSGTIVDPSGVILTNFHCVGHTDLGGKTDEVAPGTKHGQLYRPDGLLAVGLTTDPKKAPQPTYFARYVAGTADFDLAVVKIVSMVDETQALPAQLPLVVQKLGNSDNVQVGDSLEVFGYPGIGGHLITVTRGQVAGFDTLNSRNSDVPDEIKTDATINPGNSGGQAVNDNGEDIGIPSMGANLSKGVVGVNLVRMINVAVPYINAALGTSNDPNNSAQPNQPTQPVAPVQPVVPTAPTATSAPFGPLTFGTGWDNASGLTGVGATLPSGVKRIYVQSAYQGLQSSTPWGTEWTYNGKVVLDKHNAFSWNGDASGTEVFSLTNRNGFPDGTWGLILFVNNQPVQQGSVVVGQSTAQPKPQPPTNQAPSTVVRGQIVDANTGQGIAAAAVFLLKPGVTVAQWAQDQYAKADVAAAAQTASDGSFETAPAVAPGQKYTVVIVANGYQARVFENGLSISPDQSGVLTLDQPIALQSK